MLLSAVATVAIASLGAPSARAAAPYWTVKVLWGDTNLPPGGEGQFELGIRNAGDAPPSAAVPLEITDELPKGVTVKSIHWDTLRGEVDLSPFCSGVGTGTATCEASFGEFPFSLLNFYLEFGNPFPGPEYLPEIFIEVEVDPGVAETGTNVARVEGAGATAPFADEDQVTFSPTPSSFGVRPSSFEADVFSSAYPFGKPVRQAGDRPFELRMNFELNQESGVGGDGTRYDAPNALVRTVEVTLPLGMLGNPEAIPRCSEADFASGVGLRPACPPDTQIGYASIRVNYGTWYHGMGNSGGRWSESIYNKNPLYNLEPPRGVPADFAFSIAGIMGAHIFPVLDPARNYAIEAVTPYISSFAHIAERDSEVTIWGVPSDPAHDRYRYRLPTRQNESTAEATGAHWGSDPIRPLLTNPTDCGVDNGGALISVDSYKHPEEFTPAQEYPDPLDVSGCGDPRFHFEPDITLQPSSRNAGAPTGLDVHIHVPQRNDEVAEARELYAKEGGVKAIPTPPLRKVIVTFPEGMAISSSAVQGLGSCSPEQISLGANAPVTCPERSRFGTLTVHSPMLSAGEALEGYIYVATQNDNPFHNLLSLYFVVENPNRGILVKIPGRVDLDPLTGQISTSFDELPQFPLSDIQIHFKGGVLAAMVNPTTCGKKTIKAELFSWQEPSTPRLASDSYDITQKPDGSPCVSDPSERPFKPQLQAGTLDPAAGRYAPFFVRLTREDSDQNLSRLGITLPQGLLARLAGISYCPDSALGAITVDESNAAVELASPSCPGASLLGTVIAGLGPGSNPLYLETGKAYLAGPYRGAPFSVAIVIPAIAGPFDLGTIVVRAALYIDPETARITLRADPLPAILQGIPLDLRDLRIKLDRPDFVLNPTSCEPMSFRGEAISSLGESAQLSDRFQASDCTKLGFRPRLHLRFSGGTGQNGHPRVRMVLKRRKGDANLAGAAVTLPRSEFLDRAHIRAVCTQDEFAKGACPPASIVGYAKAWTPLLDRPLEGPIYLRASQHRLPDLAASLDGEIHLDIAGRVDSVNGAIRNLFEGVPDVPISKLVLTLAGGRKGLLINSEDLCARPRRATVVMHAHNGRVHDVSPIIRGACRRRSRIRGH